MRNNLIPCSIWILRDIFRMNTSPTNDRKSKSTRELPHARARRMWMPWHRRSVTGLDRFPRSYPLSSGFPDSRRRGGRPVCAVWSSRGGISPSSLPKTTTLTRRGLWDWCEAGARIVPGENSCCWFPIPAASLPTKVDFLKKTLQDLRAVFMSAGGTPPDLIPSRKDFNTVWTIMSREKKVCHPVCGRSSLSRGACPWFWHRVCDQWRMFQLSPMGMVRNLESRAASLTR